MTFDSEYIWYKLFKTEGVGSKTIHSIYNNTILFFYSLRGK